MLNISTVVTEVKAFNCKSQSLSEKGVTLFSLQCFLYAGGVTNMATE